MIDGIKLRLERYRLKLRKRWVGLTIWWLQLKMRWHNWRYNQLKRMQLRQESQEFQTGDSDE